MNRDAILAKLLEIEGMLLDARLSDEDRHALHGAAQALRHVLDAATWQPASQTFYRVGDRPAEPAPRWCTEGSTMTTIHIFKHQLRRP
jgi:hypothetical protein